nr:MAG TPA: hypothetical protein [Caudoviricetes sp.]
MFAFCHLLIKPYVVLLSKKHLYLVFFLKLFVLCLNSTRIVYTCQHILCIFILK